MKRRRRKVPTKLLYMQARRLWTGGVIPPCSFVKAKVAGYGTKDQIFRIGYYGRTDGLDCIWLVNEAGKYEQTVDQKLITSDFEVIERSNETDLYGDDREILGPIDKSTTIAMGMA